MANVFISYSSDDRPFALRLAEDVGKFGNSVWIDVQEISGREPYWDEIKEAIESCAQFVFLISPDSVSKARSVWKELYHADSLRPRPNIVPIMVRPTLSASLPIQISPGIYQIHDAVKETYEGILPRVLTALSTMDTEISQRQSVNSPNVSAVDFVDLNDLYAEFYKVRNEYIQFSRSGKVDGDEHVRIISAAQTICIRASGMAIKCPTDCLDFDTSPNADLGIARQYHEKCKDYFDYIAEKWLTPNQVTREHNPLEAQLWGEYRQRNETALEYAKGMFEKSFQQPRLESKVERMKPAGPVDDMTVYMQDLVERLGTVNPIDPYKEATSEQLETEFMQALKNVVPLVVDFARLCKSLIWSQRSAFELRVLYDSFGEISTCYHPYKGFGGTYSELGFDFYRFIGHELFVILFSFLIRRERWKTIERLLSQPIYVRNTPQYVSDMLPFSHISQGVRVFEIINAARNPMRLSLHADVLQERYSSDELKQLVSVEQFIEADYFLYLRREADTWRPRSWWYIRYAPKYLVKAKVQEYAERLLAPLNLESISALQERIRERNTGLLEEGTYVARGPFSRSALENFDVKMIGSLQSSSEKKS